MARSSPAAHAVVTAQIFIGLVARHRRSATSGRAFGVGVRPLADAFLRMIKMIIAPLLFSTLVVGIAGTGDLKAMGRIGLKAIDLLRGRDDVALCLGLVLVNIFKPGAGVTMPLGGRHDGRARRWRRAQQHAWDILLHLFPTSVVDAMARGDILQVVVFATFFGVALAAIGAEGQPVVDVLDSVAQVMFKVTGYVMRVRADRRVRGDGRDGRRQRARRSCSRSASWSR